MMVAIATETLNEQETILEHRHCRHEIYSNELRSHRLYSTMADEQDSHSYLGIRSIRWLVTV